MANWLITGVGSELGAAIAAAALARGDRVCGTVRNAADATAFEASAPGLATALTLDLRDAAAIPGVAAAAESEFGQIDFLVNNAGYGMAGAIEESGMDQIRALFDVNVFGAIAMIQAVLPAMRARRGGHIVNITSVSGWAPWSGTAIYGASKFAMEGIGQTLADEVAPLGIKVTNVAPGGIKTGFGSRSLVEAATQIADYDGGAHMAKIVLKADHGTGDAALAAKAILIALDDPEPPINLLLGADALHYAEDQIAALTARIARWRELSLSITPA